MVTTVEVSRETRDRLEQLQAEIELETGTTVTQGEVLDRLVERAFESRTALIESFRDDFDGLSPEEIEQFLSGTSDWGIETTVAEIDRIRYEQEPLDE